MYTLYNHLNIVLFYTGRSFDMKYVIHQMLDRDASSRPTVDQVLAFPYVRKVWSLYCQVASSRPTVDQVLAFPYVRKVWSLYCQVFPL